MDFILVAFIVAVPVSAGALLVPLIWDTRACLDERRKRLCIWKWWLAYFLGLTILVTAGAAAGSVFLFLVDLMPTRFSYLPTYCKILTKDVDLRTTKLCGFRQPFSSCPHFPRRRRNSPEVRCYFEYYWASVFEVEFWPKASMMPVYAAAETPSNLLPAHCRPDFDEAWQMKEKFKVNGTYPCKYNPYNLRLVNMADEDERHMACRHERPAPLADLGSKLWLHLVHSDVSPFSPVSPSRHVFWAVITGLGIALPTAAAATWLSLCPAWLWPSPHTSKQQQQQNAGNRELEKVLRSARIQGGFLFVTTISMAVRFGYQYRSEVVAYVDHVLFSLCAAVGCM